MGLLQMFDSATAPFSVIDRCKNVCYDFFMQINSSDDTRTKLLKSAILMFNQYGPMVPISKISDRAGVAAGTPFKHFKTKEELLRAAYDYAHGTVSPFKQENPETLGTAEEIVKSIVRTIIRWATRMPDEHEYLKKYEQAACYDYYSEPFDDLYPGILFELDIWPRIQGDLRADIPMEVVNRMISMNCDVFIRYAGHRRMQLATPELDALVEAAADSVWNSVAGPSAR